MDKSRKNGRQGKSAKSSRVYVAHLWKGYFVQVYSYKWCVINGISKCSQSLILNLFYPLPVYSVIVNFVWLMTSSSFIGFSLALTKCDLMFLLLLYVNIGEGALICFIDLVPLSEGKNFLIIFIVLATAGVNLVMKAILSLSILGLGFKT